MYNYYYCNLCSPHWQGLEVPTSNLWVSLILKIKFVKELDSAGLPGQKLSWTKRISAAIEMVKGIQFLHTGIVPGVWSNNLKITDILLDQDLHVKISCYNLRIVVEHGGMV